ncbi:TetR/AcrR family transcriptional regulator [Streptomyces sp. NPDC050418]|uniref:TetR/AcrR family transcriptional regulator n=1 Tax=Streptomyces sp. NPDC050418 TaxID=3365612 RepID=UPI0037ADC2FF
MPDQEHQATAPKPRRRQARGERRAAQLLDAAAVVFSRVGYTAASTNAIAREAGVSPGTLYQFFPNKEAIAVDLGNRLLEQWRESYGQALSAANLELPLAEMVDAVVDPLLDFNAQNPAFHVLMHGPDTPGQVTDAFEVFHSVVLRRIEEILTGYLPDIPPAEATRVTTTTLALFKAGLDLIAAHPDEREAYQAELKKVLFRYLDPMLCEIPPGPPAAEAPVAEAPAQAG